MFNVEEEKKSKASTASSTNKKEEKSVKVYVEIISDSIYKLAIHLKTSGQEITKLKSLQSMISNILKNKFANKNTPDELKAAIKADYRLANKILNVMNTLQIININSTKTKVDVFKHKIEEIAQMERISDEDQFEKEMNAYKEKIKNEIA